MSQSERGDYRAIRQVLLDGPDFQKLSERARFAFITMKIGAGPTGLEVEYSLGAVEKVGIRTGMGARAAKKALQELENSGWVEREGNLIWIDGHLKNEPNMRPTDGNHRKSIQRYVAGLPRLSLVRRFIAAHPEWFPESEMLANGLGWTLTEGPTGGPPKGPASTEDRRPRTITEDRRPKTDVGDPPPEPRPPAPATTSPPSDFAAFGPLATQLPTDGDRDALNIVLGAMDNPKTWYFEMTASLDGMGGHVHVDTAQLGQALRDYVADGAYRRKKLREFRAYLEKAAKGSEPRPTLSNGAKGRIERGREALARFAGETDGQ